MAKALVITEKPSVARDIVAALGGFTEHDGYWESDGFVVTFAVGHLLELLEPEEIDPRYKRWTLADLPILPEQFQLKKKKGQTDRIRTIEKLLALPPETFPVILGGDHSIAMGSVTGASRRERTAVIWVDAHGDFNTTETSPSGNIHGMRLGALCGVGDRRLIDLGWPGAKIRPEDVVLIGVGHGIEIRQWDIDNLHAKWR